MPLREVLSKEAFIEWLRSEGASRYHDRHAFHVLMHDGKLTREQLRAWAINRYYYQTRIPIKDALIVAKSEDPGFRRIWLRRIQDHDGNSEHQGGLYQWILLAKALDIDREELLSFSSVLPRARVACDAYVSFVREASLLESVASSLTECFAPDLMQKRLIAWEKHYPWIDPNALVYFRERPARAKEDAAHALDFVVSHAKSDSEQAMCVAALVRKTAILWQLLDAIHEHTNISSRP